MLELEDAVARILSDIPPPSSEAIPLGTAHRRIPLEQILSPMDLPPFDNSSMDGYLVRAADVANANADAPVELQVIGKIGAGQVFDGKVGAGKCVRIFTGSPLPAGADAVVMQEDTRSDAASPNKVLILEAAKPWENVRLRGEDIKAGTTLLKPGTALTAGQLTLLAATGVSQTKVGRRPRVGLLATGSELIEPGAAIRPGQIYESNRTCLAALVSAAGGLPETFPLVPDTLGATRDALASVFEKCDIVVTSGGVSVGEMDFVKQAFEDLGGTLQFWKVAIKPGRPFVYGQRKEKFLFGLPGNPVSAFVTFLLLVRPALLRWQGATEASLPAHSAVLAEPLDNRGSKRRHFMRVRMSPDGPVYSAGMQASHALSSLAAATGLVDVPPDTMLGVGSFVSVLRWGCD